MRPDTRPTTNNGTDNLETKSRLTMGRLFPFLFWPDWDKKRCTPALYESFSPFTKIGIFWDLAHRDLASRIHLRNADANDPQQSSSFFCVGGASSIYEPAAG
jgi:hypothetical protein